MNEISVEKSLWPAPRSVARQSGNWQVPAEVMVSAEHPDISLPVLLDALRFLQPLRATDTGSAADVRISRDDVPVGGYHLAIHPDRGVAIGIRDRAGLLAASSTLRQLLPDDVWRPTAVTRSTWSLPAIVVDDEPAHEWRGLMIDVARHFLPVNQVLRYIDLLAMHKLNVLHLHLSDDQGWRVESRIRPQLNEIASWRPETLVGHPIAAITGDPDSLTFDGTPHGGLYTQSDLAAIVAHGQARGVTVVPEIDLPGHSSALLAALPELATSVTLPRLHPDVASSLKPSTISPLPAALDLVGELLAEVASAVDGPYLHVGGDEADLSDWREAPEVLEHLGALGLADVTALRQHVNQSLVETVLELGRTPIFWDEAFSAGNLDSRAVVMCWRDEAIGLQATQGGHEVVMAPVDPAYLDYAEVNHPDEPAALGYGTDLARAAAWAPPHAALGATGRILGTHAPMFTELVPDARMLDYRVFPRLCVLAQAAWSGQATDWADRRPALERHCARLHAAGVEFRPLDGPHPWQRGGTGARRWVPGISIEQIGLVMAQMQGHEPPTGQELEELFQTLTKN